MEIIIITVTYYINLNEIKKILLHATSCTFILVLTAFTEKDLIKPHRLYVLTVYNIVYSV